MEISREGLDPDLAIRKATAAVVVAVAAFAAVVSYSHIYDLARDHGQSGTAARLLPLSVDGLILAASLVLLHEARRVMPTPYRAWVMLALGVLATIAANVAYGLRFGIVGAVISAWPAVSFVGAVEMCMSMIRRARPTVPDPPEIGTVPSTVLEAAKASLTATLAAGNPLSVNQLAERFSLSRGAATKLRTEVLAGSNGHARELEASHDG